MEDFRRAIVASVFIEVDMAGVAELVDCGMLIEWPEMLDGL